MYERTAKIDWGAVVVFGMPLLSTVVGVAVACSVYVGTRHFLQGMLVLQILSLIGLVVARESFNETFEKVMGCFVAKEPRAATQILAMACRVGPAPPASLHELLRRLDYDLLYESDPRASFSREQVIETRLRLEALTLHYNSALDALCALADIDPVTVPLTRESGQDGSDQVLWNAAVDRLIFQPLATASPPFAG